MGAAELVDRLGTTTALDRVGDPLREAVWRAVPRGEARAALRGRWLGHALHPMLTDLPIGLWTSAVVLDLRGDRRAARASRTLIGLGVATSLPTAVAGLTDWSEASPRVRRQGLVHASANVVALAAFSASLVARRGDPRGGKWLARLGAAALAVGGYIGGHLTYAEGSAVTARAGVEPAGPPVGDAPAAAEVTTALPRSPAPASVPGQERS